MSVFIVTTGIFASSNSWILCATFWELTGVITRPDIFSARSPSISFSKRSASNPLIFLTIFCIPKCPISSSALLTPLITSLKKGLPSEQRITPIVLVYFLFASVLAAISGLYPSSSAIFMILSATCGFTPGL